MQTKKIISINGPVILAKGDGDFSMHDIVYIGKEQILGDVIKINKDIEGKLENLNTALKDLKDARNQRKAEDLTLPLRNALKEIINKDVEVSEADKFYNNSFDSKGELVKYSNYTDIRTALNK